jgi:hypothetical protein
LIGRLGGIDRIIMSISGCQICNYRGIDREKNRPSIILPHLTDPSIGLLHRLAHGDWV